MAQYTSDELEKDKQNEKIFLEYFNRRNEETLDLFQGKTFTSLDKCFLIKGYAGMPRIGLKYYPETNLDQGLKDEIVGKYKELFGDFAIYSECGK